MRPRGFVFDLDGTLLDNMEIHAQAFARFVARHGLPPLDAAMRARLDGKRNRDIFPILFGRELASEELHRHSDEKEGLYRELSRGRLQALRGLPRLLDLLRERGLPVAVATSAPAANVAHTLEELGLATRLRCVVRSDQVPRGKPAPDVFLAAAQAIGVPPAACAGFEDAPMGVRAVRAAGMWCVGVTTSFAAELLRAEGAHETVADFEEYLAGPGAWLVEGTRDAPPS